MRYPMKFHRRHSAEYIIQGFVVSVKLIFGNLILFSQRLIRCYPTFLNGSPNAVIKGIEESTYAPLPKSIIAPIKERGSSY